MNTRTDAPGIASRAGMNQPTEKSDATLPVNCPRCEGLFRLPAGCAATSSVECPHCNASVSVRALIDSIPVARVSRPQSAPNEAPRETPAEPAVAVAPIVDTGQPGRHAFDDGSFSIPKPLKTAQRSRSTAHPPRRSGNRPPASFTGKRESEGVAGLFKIFLGGLLALPIAQLILWWAFAMDPVGLAKPVGESVPWLVPAKMRPGDQDKAPVDITVGDEDQELPPLDDNSIPFSID